jgi:hypothetical protein
MTKFRASRSVHRLSIRCILFQNLPGVHKNGILAARRLVFKSICRTIREDTLPHTYGNNILPTYSSVLCPVEIALTFPEDALRSSLYRRFNKDMPGVGCP